MTMVRKTGHGTTILGLFTLAWCTALAEVPEPGSIEIRIHAPTIVAALIQFSQQTGLQLVLPTDNESAERKAPVVEGTFTPKDALEALLRDSGLTYTFVNSRTVSISVAETAVPSANAASPTPTSRQ